MYVHVIGVDPGPTPGIVRLKIDVNRPGWNLVPNGCYLRDAQAMQTSPGLLEPVLDLLARGAPETAIAVERFVVGRRSARSATASAGEQTRDMVGVITAWASRNDIRLFSRSATEIKPWATDRRLAATGWCVPSGRTGHLLEPLTTGMRHARDAARHALYCAVRDYGLPDPLSRKAA